MCAASRVAEQHSTQSTGQYNTVNNQTVHHTPSVYGMNVLFPQALNFDDRSSVLDTQEACSRYGIKPPSLNADRLEELLKKTDMNEDLQASLVRGWRE